MNYLSSHLRLFKGYQINSHLNETYYYRANDFAKQGDFTRSLSDYTKTIEINPSHAEAYNNRGYIYNQQKDYNKAFLSSPKLLK